MVLIEMNPRVSRSSALASKATGFPIAKIAALLAVGLPAGRDRERHHRRDARRRSSRRSTTWSVKIPRFAFEKFPEADPTLTSTMKSVGEVMAIGRTFKEALGKAWRGLEKAGFDLGATLGAAPEPLEAVVRPHRGPAAPRGGRAARRAHGRRGRRGLARSTRGSWTRSRRWSRRPRALRGRALHALRRASSGRRSGWVCPTAGSRVLTDSTEAAVRRHREALGVAPVFKTVDTCGGEFPARTPYHYSTYEEETEVRPAARPRVVILGPARTGSARGSSSTTPACMRRSRWRRLGSSR